MQIRKSVPQDLERIMEIYAYARQFMAQHGNPNQWGPTNWPPEALIRKDIADGSSYVCENGAGKVIGTFFFTQGSDIEPTYREITDGNWLDKSPYGIVHRIASDGSEKGTGAFCINWAYDQCGHLRMDTHGDNTVMQNLLRKLGFIHCGTIYVQEDSYPRLAYEKSEACAADTGKRDFSTITACGECCTGCPKKLDGRCPGCIEADGRVPEWAESGRCRVHACTREHHAQFCGLCAEFPCEKITEMISWNPDIIRKMTLLRDEYTGDGKK